MRMQSTNALFRRATLSSSTSTLSIVRRSTLTATRGFSSTSTTPRTSATTNSSAALPLRTPTRTRQFPTTATPSTTRTMASAACSTSPSSSSPGYEKIPNTSIRILRTVSSVRRFRKPLTLDSRSVALVPTMGALHAGHLSLIRAAARDNHHVIVSIYVNPAQFGVREDLGSYPVTWEADCEALAKLDRELADDGENLGRISAVFAPTTGEMYPAGFPGQELDSKGSFVTITPVGEVLEGASRPTFFRGVATVCMKLFNVCQPDRVYFGQKDVQQTVVIKRLVEDFLMPIEQVVIVPTARDQEDGLALSSRNVYLGERRRKVANVLYRALKAAEEAYAAGEGKRDRVGVLGAAQKVMEETLAEQMKLSPSERVKFEVDYLSLADPDTMLELETVDTKKGGILSGAVRFLPVEEPKEGEDLGHSGGPLVRLIDNIILPPK
ncbi:pantoate-beta-alanine ligase [Neurospora crassa]|uniref:Pantoate--beta-alanine ligase n=1 Tax=Neurospora crassa (strain ATCC 24698 / 74-OR23-1A / CBS 708.71 / DSM 1257 / FGSC 987) TaxID=367110 RepID=Q7S8P2_NEUCR|nr:pantoate-beta-alanine ligase [Neurospora crassa OR74A]EAA32726.2 pantoate-beta-alanine ligase [Neurospora crassa OR74A]KHE82828.1 pantoate-beta-alanine ligase [Neurospora crassa]|eukprot:XP_961962.2 pantoate-beta-alanine ligase [Neurospora crassa OR74A]